MANPAVQSTTTALSSGIVTSVTIPFTVASSLSNPLLVVLITSAFNPKPSNVDWNGTSLTQISISGTSIFFPTSAWYLSIPSAATSNVTVTWSPNNEDVGVTVVLLTDAGTPDDAVLSSSNTGNVGQTIFETITVNQSGSMLLEWMMSDKGMGNTTLAGQTEIYNTTTSPDPYRVQSSYKGGFATGSQSMGVTVDSGGTTGGIYEIAVLSVPPPPVTLQTVDEDINVMVESVSVHIVVPLVPFISDSTAVSDNQVMSVGYAVVIGESTAVTDLPYYFDNTFIMWESVAIQFQGDVNFNVSDQTIVSDNSTIPEPYIPVLWTDLSFDDSIWVNETAS